MFICLNVLLIFMIRSLSFVYRFSMLLVHPKLCNINPHNVAHSLISQNPMARMFIGKISLLVITYLSLTSQNSAFKQTTKEANPHPRIVPCVDTWSITFLFSFFFFFFLCHLLNVGACARHITPGRPSGVDHTSVGDGKTNSNHPHISLVSPHIVTCHHASVLTTLNPLISRALWLPRVWYYGV
jgi:hypothetical protein